MGEVAAVAAKYIVPERVYIKISGSMDFAATAATILLGKSGGSGGSEIHTS